jgi:hypothetical protein
MSSAISDADAQRAESERFLRDIGYYGANETTESATRENRRALLWMHAPFDRFDLNELTEQPPARHFVVHPYLPDGAAAVLTGAGGTNKTGLVVGRIATAIAAGLELFGEPVRLGRVLVISAEDRRDTVLRHIWANTRDLSDRQRKNVSENLFVKDTVGTGFLLTRHIDGSTDTSPDVGQLTEYAREIEGLRLIVFDTLSRLNGGEESNEDLARFVSAMERVSVETGAATLALHHVGKAQMRADANDQYSSRGGSALSDNARSVLNLTRITPEMKDAPTNAAELIAQGRLLRLSHVKSNYAAAASDRYFERVQTPHAARLVEFRPEFAANDVSATWARIEAWMTKQTEVAHPTRGTIEALGGSIGSRAAVRRALQWAEDRGHLIEAPHPNPHGGRKTYLRAISAGLDGDVP